MRIDAQGRRVCRTEEERERRHLHGDAGARFAGKYTCPSNDGCAACITTSADKDDITIEWYER